MASALRQPVNPLGLSVAGHLLLFALISLNMSWWQSHSARPVRLAIDATVVLDTEALRQREAAARERQAAAERARAEARQRQQERERRRRVEQQRAVAEQRRVERERAAAEAAQREAAARRERERVAAEIKRKEEAIARQRAAQRARQAEREAMLRAQLAAEQAREDAVRGGLLDQWIEVIRQKVQRNWIKPASAGPGLECELRLRQIPGGDVVDVQIGRCNGDAAVRRSIENAVYRASPLPSPPDPSLFERNLVLVFKPGE